MKYIGLVLMVCLMFGCAGAPKSVNNPNLSKAQAEGYLEDCVVRNIKEIDDKKSDPRTIAEAAFASCQSEFRDYKWALVKQSSATPRAKHQFVNNNDSDLTAALEKRLTAEVLRLRKQK
jgi:hypothetical protein